MRAPMIALLLVGLALPASSVLSSSALGQNGAPPTGGVQFQPIGKVATAKGSFTITHGEGVALQANVGPNGGLGQAKVGDPVYQHDIVQTGADGTIGLTLNDGTAFNVSTNARIVLDEFVYDPNSTSNSALISLTKGTFTFIAGKVAKTGDLKVDTPVATMGIRGTAPRVEIAEDGTVRFANLVEGYLRNGPARAPGQPGRRALQQDRGGGKTTPQQRQRQAQNDLAIAGIDRVIKDQSKALDGKLNICRGC
jgi:hypothetical protein